MDVPLTEVTFITSASMKAIVEPAVKPVADATLIVCAEVLDTAADKVVCVVVAATAGIQRAKSKAIIVSVFLMVLASYAIAMQQAPEST
jgi:hypothetical protein